MLEPVEVLPGHRRAIRRAVHLQCQLVSDLWDEPVPFVAKDLSPYGMWVETPFPLEPGSELVVSFTPPRWPRDREMLVCAKVRRVGLRRRRSDPGSSGMGLVFEDLAEEDAEELSATLRGLPPPLPSPGRRGGVWREYVSIRGGDEEAADART